MMQRQPTPTRRDVDAPLPAANEAAEANTSQPSTTSFPHLAKPVSTNNSDDIDAWLNFPLNSLQSRPTHGQSTPIHTADFPSPAAVEAAEANTGQPSATPSSDLTNPVSANDSGDVDVRSNDLVNLLPAMPTHAMDSNTLAESTTPTASTTLADVVSSTIAATGANISSEITPSSAVANVQLEQKTLNSITDSPVNASSSVFAAVTSSISTATTSMPAQAASAEDDNYAKMPPVNNNTAATQNTTPPRLRRKPAIVITATKAAASSPIGLPISTYQQPPALTNLSNSPAAVQQVNPDDVLNNVLDGVQEMGRLQRLKTLHPIRYRTVRGILIGLAVGVVLSAAAIFLTMFAGFTVPIIGVGLTGLAAVKATVMVLGISTGLITGLCGILGAIHGIFVNSKNKAAVFAATSLDSAPSLDVSQASRVNAPNKASTAALKGWFSSHPIQEQQQENEPLLVRTDNAAPVSTTHNTGCWATITGTLGSCFSIFKRKPATNRYSLNADDNPIYDSKSAVAPATPSSPSV